MQKITPFLWFDNQAEEAANYYVSVFPNSKVNQTTRYSESAVEIAGKPAGSVMTVEFELDGQKFTALNGGKVPGFDFSPAISFAVTCESQEEIDHLWQNLSSVPEAEQCGWCTDKFGVTWQIVPRILGELLNDSDNSKVERVTAAFMQMKKFDIEALQRAADSQ